MIKYLSTAAAARLANISHQRMQRLCKDDRVFGATLELGRWKIHPEFRIIPGASGPELNSPRVYGFALTEKK